MKRRNKIITGVLLSILVLTGVGAYVAYREMVGTETFDEGFYAKAQGGNADFSYDSYASVLREHVDDRGMVSYAALKEDPGELNRFVRALAAVKPETYRSWEKPAQVAFWINAYNALTLKVIIDHYPIEAGLVSGLAYPDNSIRQIPGVWDNIKFLLIGDKLTLNQIEHAILRGKRAQKFSEKFGRFNEPRIHVALVCAAMGCPELRQEPYVGEKLDDQLDDQSRTFMKSPEKFRIDRDADKVYLSSIFEWFGEDFIKTYLPGTGFGDHSKTQRSVLHYASNYLSSDDAAYLRTGDFSIEYLDYDWSLNEQKTPEQ